MTKDKDIKTVVPLLRFPEFRDSEGWNETTLGAIASITNGKANAQDHIEQGKYPLFDRSDVIKSTDNYLFDCEAVIIPGEGMKFIPKYYVGKFNLHQRAYVLKDFSCIGKYVYYLMEYRSDLLSVKAVKSTVLSLRLPILQNFPIQLSNNPNEQTKIADCFSSLDDLISAVTDKIEALKEHKKGLMQQLFPADGKTTPAYRFPQFQNAGEWKFIPIKGCDVDTLSGYAFKGIEISEKTDGVPLMRGINITEGVVRHNNDIDRFYDGELCKLLKYKLLQNDIVIAMDGSKVGRNYAIIDMCDQGSLLVQRVARLRSNSADFIRFIYQQIGSGRFKAYVDRINTSSGIPHISMSQIECFEIWVPTDKEEVKMVANCLCSFDELIDAQTQKLDQLKAHKKGLMQQLFPILNK